MPSRQSPHELLCTRLDNPLKCYGAARRAFYGRSGYSDLHDEMAALEAAHVEMKSALKALQGGGHR